jgi:hypothetical protein
MTSRITSELRRHFLHRFFDSDLVTTPGQWRVVAAGAAGIVASLILLVTQSYYGKYLRLLEMDSPDPFRMAMLADHLFFVTIAMAMTALFTLLLWPSLFPSLRDYLGLAGLPVKPSQIFVAKFTALFALAGGFIVAVNLLPSLMLPAVSKGCYQEQAFLSAVTLFVAAALASLFVFFVFVALQGVLLNLVPPHSFPAVSLLVQGGLLIAVMIAILLILSIPGFYWAMDFRPDWALQVPPVWFLGIDQYLLGNREPFTRILVLRAIAAVAIAAVTAGTAYLWSYRRHRVRVLETLLAPVDGSGYAVRAASRAADRLIPDLAERAVFSFMVRTLLRSPHHRLALTLYAGIAIAVVASAFVSLALGPSFRNFAVRSSALEHAAASIPLVFSLFLLAGFRYLFRLPVELRANWVFQVNEGGNRRSFLAAADRFILWFAIFPVAALTFPVEAALLGWRDGAIVTALSTMTALILRELLLYQFQKIPFTCAYLPGKRSLVETLLLYGAGVATYISIFTAVLVWCLQEPAYSLTFFGLLFALWAHLRRHRIEDALIGAIEYEELPEPAVRTLAIDPDW